MELSRKQHKQEATDDKTSNNGNKTDIFHYKSSPLHDICELNIMQAQKESTIVFNVPYKKI